MNIYSIEEIVNATNDLLYENVKSKEKKITKTSNESIPLSIENIIIEAENAQILKKDNQIIEEKITDVLFVPNLAGKID